MHLMLTFLSFSYYKERGKWGGVGSLKLLPAARVVANFGVSRGSFDSCLHLAILWTVVDKPVKETD